MILAFEPIGERMKEEYQSESKHTQIQVEASQRPQNPSKSVCDSIEVSSLTLGSSGFHRKEIGLRDRSSLVLSTKKEQVQLKEKYPCWYWKEGLMMMIICIVWDPNFWRSVVSDWSKRRSLIAWAFISKNEMSRFIKSIYSDHLWEIRPLRRVNHKLKAVT